MTMSRSVAILRHTLRESGSVLRSAAFLIGALVSRGRSRRAPIGTVLVGAALLALGTLIPLGTPAWAEPGATTVAVTAFEFVQTSDPISGGRPTDAEQQRLRAAEAAVHDWFAQQEGVNVTAEPDAQGRRLRRCDRCALDLGQELGADWVTVGWVQKVSELILNMNLIVWDVASETRLAAVSVDMRGNTDESWRRAGEHLLKNLHKQGLGAAAASQVVAR